MKKLSIILLLSTALFALPMTTVHAANAPETNADGKYWTFWQGLQNDAALKKREAFLTKSLLQITQSALIAQSQFNNSCQKSNDQRCGDFLETLLKAEQALLTATKKMARRGKLDLRKALRDLKKL